MEHMNMAGLNLLEAVQSQLESEMAGLNKSKEIMEFMTDLFTTPHLKAEGDFLHLTCGEKLPPTCGGGDTW